MIPGTEPALLITLLSLRLPQHTNCIKHCTGNYKLAEGMRGNLVHAKGPQSPQEVKVTVTVFIHSLCVAHPHSSVWMHPQYFRVFAINSNSNSVGLMHHHLHHLTHVEMQIAAPPPQNPSPGSCINPPTSHRQTLYCCVISEKILMKESFLTYLTQMMYVINVDVSECRLIIFSNIICYFPSGLIGQIKQLIIIGC